MSIASEITRLQNAKIDIKSSIENKGVEVASSKTLDEYADLIDEISTIEDYDLYQNLANAILGNINPYSELEYIEGTGTQCLESLVVPTNHYIEICVQYTENTNNRVLMGVTSTDFSITWKSNKWYYAYNGTEYNGGSGISCTDKNIFYYGDGVGFKINNTVINSSISPKATSGQITFLKSSSVSTFTKAKIYYAKIYTSQGILVRDFIPVKDFNDVVCMYDKITGNFFYSIGSSVFIAGEVAE